MRANALVDGVARGAAADHPWRIKQAPRPDQVQILKQVDNVAPACSGHN
jgi:hypothetical protein